MSSIRCFSFRYSHIFCRPFGCVIINSDSSFYSLTTESLIQATFHPKVLSSVCFFGTDIHSATLGKGKNDDTLIKIRNGELAGKEVVVRHFIVSISVILIVIYVDDLWETGTQSLLQALHLVYTDFHSQDTHVPRQGRDLIRKTLEDAGVIASVRVPRFYLDHHNDNT